MRREGFSCLTEALVVLVWRALVNFFRTSAAKKAALCSALLNSD